MRAKFAQDAFVALLLFGRTLHAILGFLRGGWCSSPTAAVRPGERMDMGQVTWEMRYTYSKGSTLHAFLETSQ